MDSLLETAVEMVPGITPAELAVAAAAWLRVHMDEEPEGRVVTWARRMLGLECSASEVAELHEEGASVRQIAAATGISKSRVARMLSQPAA